MIKQEIKRVIGEIVEKRFDIPLNIEITHPKEDKFGDYTTNFAFSLSKRLKKSPVNLAAEIAPLIKSSYIEKVEVINGFINIFLSGDAILSILRDAVGENYGMYEIGNKERVLIEFVSANPTGPLTIPNARAAAIGDALVKIFNFGNYRAEAEFYVNDGGRQVDLLATSILERIKEIKGQAFSIPEGGYAGDYVKEIAKEIFSGYSNEVEGKNIEAVKEIAVEKIINMQRSTLKRYGVEFDNWARESQLRNMRKPDEIIELLRKKELVRKKEGALWFLSEKLGEKRDRVLVKTNGEFTYLLPDIAYHKDKFDRGYNLLIDLLGPDHIEQVPSIKSALKTLGYTADKIEVIIVQWVNLIKGGKKMKMSKRSGEFITMDELLDEVGVDACRFIFLLTKPSTPVNFDIDLAKEASSKNPVYYVQYGYARISSIFRHSISQGIKETDYMSADLSLITEKEAIDLVKHIGKFPEIIEMSIKERDPTHILPYLITLASLFHSFYQKYRIVDAENIPLTQARLYLARCARNTLGKGMELIGVSRREEM